MPVLDAPRLLAVVRPLMLLGIAVLSLRRAVRRAVPDADHELALLLTSAQLIQPLGHVYYAWVGAAPLMAVGMAWKNGVGSTGKAWMANRLVVAALVGLVFPLCSFPLHPLITVSVGSVYFWALSALWLFLITLPSEVG